MSQGPLPIEYSEVSRSGGATAEAGMLPYLDLIEAAGLRQSMRRRVGLREQGQSWTDDQLLTAGVLLNLAGGDSVDDLRVLEGDEGLGRMLRRAERHGLHRRRGEALARRWRRPRTRSVPSPTSLRRYLERFHDAQEEHKREPQRAFIPAPGAALRGLGRVNADLLAFAQRHDRQRQATLDMDATLVESSKRQAFYSYQHSRAYQPLTTYWAETDAVLHSEFRDGNVPAGFEQLRVLQEALEMLPSGVERVLMRSDTAGYQQELLRYCAEGRDARFGVIEFAVGAPVNAEFRRAVRRVPEGEWRTLPSRNEESPESDQQYAEVNYVPTWIGNHHLGPEYRFIATRERYRNPPLPGLLTDGELPSRVEELRGQWYRVFAMVTNRTGDAGELIHWSRERCGKGEEIHSAIKGDFAGGRLPSGLFGANAAWWAMVVLASNLNAMFKRLLLPAEWASRRHKAVRFSLIGIAGRVVRRSRTLQIQLRAGHPAYPLLVGARQRLLTLANAPP